MDAESVVAPSAHEMVRDASAGRDLEIDHDRLMALVDALERDIALIEGAMADVEMREFVSANAALDVLDGVSSA